MSEQQARSRRAYDESQKAIRQTTEAVLGRVQRQNADNARQRNAESDRRNRANNLSANNHAEAGVPIGVGKFILGFLVIGVILFALFGLIVLIVIGLQ